MTQTTTVSARDLLQDFLELHRIAPDIAKWDEKEFATNPPRLLRLKRLKTLFSAFGIDWNAAKFMRGGFIEPNCPRYGAILERAAAEMSLSLDEIHGPQPYQLPRCFEILLRYRETVEATVSCFAETLMASGLYSYALRKSGELNQVIRNNVGIVDDILVSFISPEARIFPLDQLVGEFGYPDADLLSTDVWYLLAGVETSTDRE